MINAQNYFEHFLQLVGKTVNVGVRLAGQGNTQGCKTIRGKVSNAMFDSFILQGDGKTFILRFEDILFLDLP